MTKFSLCASSYVKTKLIKRLVVTNQICNRNSLFVHVESVGSG